MRSAGAPFITTDPVGAQRVALAELLVAAAEGRVHVVTTLTSSGRGEETWDVHLVVDEPVDPTAADEDGDDEEDERV